MNDTDIGTLLVDAHVHVYDCFDIDTLLDAALHNFNHAAKKTGLYNGFSGVLLLSETSNDNWFLRSSMVDSCSHWQIEKTRDKTVLQARLLTDNADNINVIYIVAGRQIITAEGLELLALVTDSTFKDGLPINSALSTVREQDAVPVLPWAAGKWLGKRGKILSSLLAAEVNNDLCLGDNSGRPALPTRPPLGLAGPRREKSNSSRVPASGHRLQVLGLREQWSHALQVADEQACGLSSHFARLLAAAVPVRVA